MYRGDGKFFQFLMPASGIQLAFIEKELNSIA